MAQMTQNINYIPNEPELKDLLDYFKKQIKLELNCHHIGTINSFDSSNQTAQVSINYAKTFLQIDSVGATSVVTSNYPVLVDCPVICLGGGGTGALTFPIAAGDECLLLFNDRDLDNWFSGSSGSAPASGRLHAFSDAVVLVGLRSMGNVIPNYVADAVALQYQGNSIQIAADTVSIQMQSGVTLALDGTGDLQVSLGSGVNFEMDAEGKFKFTNGSGELIASIVQLMNDIQSGLVTTMLGPMPLVMPTFATDLAILQSFKA